MKIILLENIKGLGNKYDVKNVAEGYARNFLFPNRLAKIAAEREIKELEWKKAKLEKQRQELMLRLSEAAKKLSGKKFHFYPETGEKNEVFSSITSEDIKKAILDSIADLKIPEDNIEILLERPLRALGEHEVKVKLGQGIEIEIKAILDKNVI